MVLPPKVTTFNDARLKPIPHLSLCERNAVRFVPPAHHYNRPKALADTFTQMPAPFAKDRKRKTEYGSEVANPLPRMANAHPLH